MPALRCHSLWWTSVSGAFRVRRDSERAALDARVSRRGVKEVETASAHRTPALSLRRSGILLGTACGRTDGRRHRGRRVRKSALGVIISLRHRGLRYHSPWWTVASGAFLV